MQQRTTERDDAPMPQVVEENAEVAIQSAPQEHQSQVMRDKLDWELIEQQHDAFPSLKKLNDIGDTVTVVGEHSLDRWVLGKLLRTALVQWCYCGVVISFN